MAFSFFYDETEHSRKINITTINANNYYDNFSSAIVGWNEKDEESICKRYLQFEHKYESRKKNGELKSTTFKTKDFELGFASLSQHRVGFYEDLLNLYDESTILYFSVFSKIGYVIGQLFKKYKSSLIHNPEYMKYSITKAILTYRPSKLIDAIYMEPERFVDELRDFFNERISKNEANIDLKYHENKAFKEILMFLDTVEPVQSIDWDYNPPFIGFGVFLEELNVADYSLVIDKEGNEQNTVNAALNAGLKNVIEGDSKNYVGIRMADMLIGLISKMMQSLGNELRSDYSNGKLEKTLLSEGWFVLNDSQLRLYKRLYKIICVDNKHWYKTYTGTFSDDLVAFVSLLQFMNHFDSVDEIRTSSYKMQPEYYNSFVCDALSERYKMMSHHLQIEPMKTDQNGFFINIQGARVNIDIEKQPMLPINDKGNVYHVLSVGVTREFVPTVTILEEGNSQCYRIPKDYCGWAVTVVGLADMGENYFPTDVKFTKKDSRYYVDIL